MALDEPKESDEIFDANGYKFVVEKGLYKSVAPITVDLVNGYFNVISNMQTGGGECGSCSSC